MPIHEGRYEPWQGELLSPAARMFSIPRYTLEAIFTRMLSIMLFGGGSIVLLVFAVYLFLQINLDLLKMLNIQGLPTLEPSRIFYLHLSIQVLPCVIVLAMTIPKVIGPDRRNGALALVFARPITRLNYIAGKTTALAMMLGTMTVLQVALLFLLMIGMMPPDSEFRTNFWSDSVPLFARAMFCGVVICVTLSLIGAACSAVTKNKVAGSVIFLMLFFGARMWAQGVASLTGMTKPYFGLDDSLSDLCTILLTGASDRSLFWIVVHLLAWCGISLAVLFKVLKPVEVFRE